MTGGDLWSYLKNQKERRKRSEILFKLIFEGIINIKTPIQLKLSEGKKAHEYLESGKSSGKILLIPDFE